MKILDYFNICFIVFIIICIFFVINNEYKLNLEKFQTTTRGKRCDDFFEEAPSCLYRIINKLDNEIYCLCRVDIYKNGEEGRKNTFFIFDKYDSSNNFSCIDNTVKYGSTDDNENDSVFYSEKSNNLQRETDINKYIFGLIFINLANEDEEEIKNYYFEKYYSFTFRKVGSKGSKYKILDKNGRNDIKFWNNNLMYINKNSVDNDNNKYVIYNKDRYYLINKTNYKKKYGGIDNAIINSNYNVDYHKNLNFYSNNRNIFLWKSTICNLDNKRYQYENTTYKYSDYSGKGYDITSTVKKDFMCPKNYPYPFDEWTDKKEDDGYKYRYDIVKSRSKCCSVVPESIVKEDQEGKSVVIKDDEEIEDFYKSNSDNEEIYTECSGNTIDCEIGSQEGKCNIYKINQDMCTSKKEPNQVIDPKIDLKHPSEIIENPNFKLLERTTFYIKKYNCNKGDSQEGTLNIKECLPN